MLWHCKIITDSLVHAVFTSPLPYTPSSSHVVLPTLIYVLLGAAIAQASPAQASPAPTLPPTRHSTMLTSRDQGIGCLDGGLNCSGAYGKRAADALSGLDDNTWYNDSQLLGAILLTYRHKFVVMFWSSFPPPYSLHRIRSTRRYTGGYVRLPRTH